MNTHRLAEMRLPRFPLLTEAETFELLAKAKNGDHQARENLVKCNLRLIFSLLKRFENQGYEIEDLFQIGVVGLLKAIDKFDLAQEVKFSTYAVPLILGEIRRYLRDNNPLRVSRALKETALKVKQTTENLEKELGRVPSLQEVATRLNLPPEEIVAALEAVRLPVSVDEVLYREEGEQPIRVLDCLGKAFEEENVFDHVALKEALEKLPPKQRQIIYLRFFEDKTQAQVGEIVGLSQVQVSRLEQKALQKIKTLLTLSSNFLESV